MTTDEAVAAITNAERWPAAANIRNAVAFESRDGLRPWSDVDACEAAFRKRWGAEVKKIQSPIDAPRQGGNWVGG